MTSECATAAPGADLGFLGAALGRRLRAVEAAVRRLDNLDGRGERQPLPAVSRDDLREFVLRALRTVADRDNDLILREVSAGTRDAAALAARTGRPRFALWEAVSDLVQLGLLARDTVTDRVELTGAGEAMLNLVDGIVSSGITDAGESG